MRARSHRPVMMLVAAVCLIVTLCGEVGVIAHQGWPWWFPILHGLGLFAVTGGALRVAIAFFRWVDGDDA